MLLLFFWVVTPISIFKKCYAPFHKLEMQTSIFRKFGEKVIIKLNTIWGSYNYTANFYSKPLDGPVAIHVTE